MFEGGCHMLVTKAFPALLPAILATIGPVAVYLCLVRKENPLPLINSPVLVLFRKSQSRLPMFKRQQRLLALGECSQTTAPQRERDTVLLCTSIPEYRLSACWIADAVEYLPVDAYRAIIMSSRMDNFLGRPVLGVWMFPLMLALHRVIVCWLAPTLLATKRVDIPDLSREMAFCLVSQEKVILT